jgi:hypothetical protein
MLEANPDRVSIVLSRTKSVKEFRDFLVLVEFELELR